MWYHRGLGYGNDLVERPARPWDDSTMEVYARFIKPLMPAGMYGVCEKIGDSYVKGGPPFCAAGVKRP